MKLIQAPPTFRRRPPQTPRTRGGMGDWGAAVTELIAGQQLEALNSAVRRLLDKLIEAFSYRQGLLQGYQEAKGTLETATKAFGSPMTFAGPNPAVLPAYVAFESSVKAVRVMAREVQTLGFLDRVFTQISAALTRAGLSNDANSIDQALSQLKRFNLETDNMFFSQAPQYHQAKLDILAAAKNQWASMGVSANAYDDPKWMAGYIRAADLVVPVTGQPEAPESVLQAGMGALPVAAALLIWVIGIVTAGLALTSAISRLIPDANSKAKTAEKLLLKYQEQKAVEASQMRAAGQSESSIQARMNAIDREAKETVGNIPEPTSILKWVLGGALTIVGGYVVARSVGWI